MTGILMLESLTRGNTLKQGDKTPLKYRLFDADGEKLNIAGKSAKVRLVYPDFLTIGYEKDGLTVTQDDTVTFTIDNVIPSRIYHVEIIVDGQFIFPSRADESKFMVDKSSLGTEANIIEIVGVDAVVRKAVDLINEDPNLIIDEDKLVNDIISNTGIGSIEEYYQQFNDVITDLSEEKDYHSLPEISAARGGHETLGARLDETTAQLAQTDGRIDTLVALPDGSTTNDARLEDIRVGADGMTYESPAKAVREQFANKANATKTERITDFVLGYVDSTGKEITSTKQARSPVFQFPEGTKIKIVRSPEYYLGFNTSAKSDNINHSLGLFYGENVRELTITKEKPYIRFFITRVDSGELNVVDALSKTSTEIGYKTIYENDLTGFVRESSLIALDANKADRTLAKPVTDFELGYVDINGKNIESTTRARSSVYKLAEGTKIKLVRGSSYLLGFNTSSRADNIPHGGGQFYGESVYEATITKEKPYIRFFIMRVDNGTMDIADALAKNVTTIAYKVLYENTLVNLPSPAIETESLRSSNFNSSFRTPSLATGGVVTFIDDDGKLGVYTKLYPLFKKHNIPFATAIITSRIDQREDTLTLEQLHEMANAYPVVEIMNHTKDHLSLASTDEAFIHEQVGEADRWFSDNGFDVTGLVLPYGESNATSQRIVQQYYNSCYDFANNYAESFDNIRNQLIVRDVWTTSAYDANVLSRRKELVDQANLENEWLIIATHVDNGATYWDENSEAELEELILYIKAKGMKVLSPRDGFQTFGNLVENDSGFKIQANGKIVGAK